MKTIYSRRRKVFCTKYFAIVIMVWEDGKISVRKHVGRKKVMQLKSKNFSDILN